MAKVMVMEDKDVIMNQYYEEGYIVTALIGVKLDTKSINDFAKTIMDLNTVEDIFLVTGEYDMILKVKFPSYGELKDFVINRLSKINGVIKTETMMVINIYKERGIKFE